MKKIIVAFDGLKYSTSSQQYAIHIARQTNAHLVGIFLNDFTYHSYRVYDFVGNEGFEEGQLMEAEEKDKQKRAKAVNTFRKACTDAALEYSVHEDRSIAIQELLHESVFADLLVIDCSETIAQYEEKTPTNFIHELLPEVRCPVLIVPKEYISIEKLILLYDGQPSSVYAIRTFSNTLTSLKNLPTELITVNESKKARFLRDDHLIKELINQHFPQATYTVLNGEPEKAITQHLKKEKSSSLIVLGAYSRGLLSRWMRESMADVLMHEVKAPLFITHFK